MPLTVLSDTDVKNLLRNLTLHDVEKFQASLRLALHEYSTGTQDNDACATHQPERTSVKSANGTTTLFMPSTNTSGIGMKVVTLVAPSSSKTAASSAENTSPAGALTIMSSTGHPIGFLNAEEITAFRTALASSILLVRRHNVKTLTVFGSGKQAFWHIRLALLLRGHTIKTVNIVSRTFTDRVRDMVKGFYSVESERKSSEGWTNTKFSILTPAYGEYSRLIKEQLRAADVIICTVPSTAPVFDHTILSSTEGRRKGRLTIAIGSYQPHMIEIPPELLHQAVKDRSETRHFHKHALEGGVVVVDTLTGCLAEAGEIIQSQLSPQQLVEVGELVMLETPPEPPAAPEFDSNIEADLLKLRLEARSGSGSGSLASIMREDSHSTNSSGSQTVSRKSSFGRLSRRSSRSSQKRSESVDSVRKAAGKKDDHMSRWLSEGNVIYKSVGLGLMDLVVGGDLVKLAREKGVGITIQDF